MTDGDGAAEVQSEVAGAVASDEVARNAAVVSVQNAVASDEVVRGDVVPMGDRDGDRRSFVVRYINASKLVISI